jgi:diadenosine tetraphosphate (Ap4A) HIT family hydrolase
MSERCPFCNPPPEDALIRNDLCYARSDRYPVSPGHLLIVPFRHVADFFDMTREEQIAALDLVNSAKALLASRKPEGYNVGVNVGVAGGQTVMHVHIHLIPRYRGDVDDPRGGVRFVVPEKARYWSDSPKQSLKHEHQI